MAFCLVKSKADEFLRKVKSRELDVYKLSEMSSAERRAIFMGSLNLDEVTAKEVNALFESKLLLKYQKTGIKSWIEKVGGLKLDTKRDLLSRVERMEKVLNPEEEAKFLADLAEKRLKIGVSEEEAKQIFDLSQKVEEKRTLIKDGSPIRSKERIDYGVALVEFQEYTKSLKLDAEKMVLKDYLKRPQEILYKIGGITKSFLSTLDNSFFGRQGIKALYTNPDIWAKNFLKSWSDIGRTLIGRDGMLPIKADIYSRPNAISSTYQKMKLDIGINSEEAFPSSIPERIPLLGRFFKASETSFNGAALRMRADIADRVLKHAEEVGVDVSNKEQLEAIGNLVNSLTGRGSIGKAEPLGKEINALLFSVKFLKSNFDTLTAHLLDPKATAFTKKESAKNLLKIIGGIAGTLTTYSLLTGNKVEADPRSSKFGKLQFSGNTVDITGGLASIATLASRLVPTKHNGKWGLWQKSGTGKFTDLTAGKYGQTTALDVFENFWEGKLAPMAGLVRDLWKGQNYDYEKVTIKNSLKNLTLPLSVQKFEDLMKNGEDGGKILLYMILEGLGFGTTNYK